jgi:RNA 2',3'-cyclic 3'-phosphodiesterase
VAVDPPLGVREQLAAWARSSLRGFGARAGGRLSLRVLDPELLHVTLCFLGDRPIGEVTAIGDALASAARPVAELSLGAPLWLPARRPRTLAVEIHDDPHGGLHALQAELTAALAKACGFREERRRFRPHVTVARVRDHAERRGRGTRVERRSGAGRGSAAERGAREAGGEPGERGEPTLPATPALSFVAGELILYRSWLSPDGASYEPLVTHVL